MLFLKVFIFLTVCDALIVLCLCKGWVRFEDRVQGLPACPPDPPSLSGLRNS